jgi:hypothetical protein
MCLKKIGLLAQYLITILDSILGTTWGGGGPI